MIKSNPINIPLTFICLVVTVFLGGCKTAGEVRAERQARYQAELQSKKLNEAISYSIKMYHESHENFKLNMDFEEFKSKVKDINMMVSNDVAYAFRKPELYFDSQGRKKCSGHLLIRCRLSENACLLASLLASLVDLMDMLLR